MESKVGKSLEKNHKTKKCENVKCVSKEDDELLSTLAKSDCGGKARKINIDGDFKKNTNSFNFLS